PEARLAVLAAPVAEIRDPDGGAVAVVELRDRPVAVDHAGLQASAALTVIVEAVGRLQLEPGPAALLLIGGDPLAAVGADGVQPLVALGSGVSHISQLSRPARGSWW